MFVQKNFSFKNIMAITGGHLIWLSAWAMIVASIYYFTDWKWLSIPWLPLSVIGTSVAFYVGFKNNQAYDRLWEARKIWGAIINSSRSWGSSVRSFIRISHTSGSLSETELNDLKESLINRHIAWTYQFREQLLVTTQWEHASLHGQFGKVGQKRRRRYGKGAFDEDIPETHLQKYLQEKELAGLAKFKNPATRLIDIQAQELASVREKGLLNDLTHIELQKILNDFYDHQGRAERIKKFPLPRQYGSMSFIFVCIFIFMLPFGMVSEFNKLGEWGIWLSVPFCIMTGWIFVVMELIGDYSENPFEGLENDVPMFSICRTIEIDLLQMMGKTNLPAAVEAKRGVLM